MRQPSNSFRKYFTDISSILFAFLFLYAAFSKLIDYQKFTVQLGQSPMLTHFSGFIAWFIPAAEIIIAILLIVPFLRINGLYAFFSLMVMFTAYIIAITRFSEYVPCSCGGILQKMNWNQHLLFNLFTVLLGAVNIFLYIPDDQKKPQLK